MNVPFPETRGLRGTSVIRALGTRSRIGNSHPEREDAQAQLLELCKEIFPACCWNTASRTWHEWLRGLLLLLALPKDAVPIIGWKQFNPWPVAHYSGCLLSHTLPSLIMCTGRLKQDRGCCKPPISFQACFLCVSCFLNPGALLLSQYCSFSVYNASYLLIPNFFFFS